MDRRSLDIGNDEKTATYSVSIYSDMVHWPDNPPVSIEHMQDMSHGDAAKVSKIEMGVHTGTHMDGPQHFLADGAGIDDIPFDATIGPARVISIEHPRAILPAELEQHNLQAGERVLFRTQNSERCWKTDQFIEDFIYNSAAVAQFPVERQVRTVGVDYLSVGGYVHDGHDGIETHQILLEAGVWLIEGLKLSAVTPGTDELIGLPLRTAGADGAPARAILWLATVDKARPESKKEGIT
jgi:arylformamidase